MRNVRVDMTGELRCWRCGSTSFQEKRTAASKVTLGVGALLTRRKLKCNVCSQYNMRPAKPYKGPASKRLGHKYGTLTNMFGAEVPDGPDEDIADDYDPPAQPAASPVEMLERLAQLHGAGHLTAEEFAAQKKQLLGMPTPPPPPPSL